MTIVLTVLSIPILIVRASAARSTDGRHGGRGCGGGTEREERLRLVIASGTSVNGTAPVRRLPGRDAR